MRDKAISLRENTGLSIKAIADRLGINRGTVAYWCTIDGVDPPPALRRKNTLVWAPKAAAFLCGGILRRHVTPEEDKTIMEMYVEGKSLTEIGRRIGRSPNVVHYRLARMAREEARREDAHV